MPNIALEAPLASTASGNSRLAKPDIIILFVLGLASVFLTWYLSHQISYQLRGVRTQNVWFEADVSRVYQNILSWKSDNHRSNVHPIYTLPVSLAFPVIYKLFHLSTDQAVNVILAITAGIWPVLMYLVLRRLSFDRFISALLSVAGIVSAGGLFFFSVPETYGLASVSILLTIYLLMIGEGTFWQPATDLLASMASLGITITNWTLGLVGTFRGNPFLRWIQLTINAFFGMTILWTIQRAFIHTSVFFLVLGEERSYTIKLSIVRLFSVFSTFFLNSMAAPPVKETADFGVGEFIGPGWKSGLTIQHGLPGTGSIWAIIALVIWTVVLILGFRKVMPLLRNSRVLTAVVAFLVFQLLLHSIYGVETFMYSLDWIPLLLLISAFGFQALGRGRYPALVVFVALLAANNFPQFAAAARIIQGYAEKTPVQHALTPTEAEWPGPCAPPLS